MIVQKTVQIGGTEYKRTSSDAGFMLERDGVLYEEAIDPIGSDRIYSETSVPIEADPEEVSAEEALAELMEVLA